MRPNWQTLYSGLTPDETRQIGLVLSASNTTFQVSDNGDALLVPIEQLNKARLITASKASGKSGRQGYEIFDKPDWAGSDYDEKINYQRALEGELEQTVETLNAVQSSRVHLVLSKESLFSEEQRPAKASVVLRLKNRPLDLADGEAIRNLVASAVDGLTPEHVVLLDTDGHQINGENHQSDEREAYEQLLADHILQTLEPAVGVGNVHAAVTVDFDTFSHDTIAETYDPTSVVTLSMQRSDQTTATIAPALGIPGTTSNAPNQSLPLFPSQRGENQSGKQESAAYGASKKTQHSVTGAGTIDRISAAVIINGRPNSFAEKGQLSRQVEWTQEQMKSFVSLSEAAIGYKEARGDSVVVQELSFDSPLPDRRSKFQIITSQFRVSEPIVKDILFGTAILSVIFFLLKPAARRLLQYPSGNLIGTSSTAIQESGSNFEGLQSNVDHLAFDQLTARIEQDADQSTRVLQTWIHAE